jgi:hypothetical protein
MQDGDDPRTALISRIVAVVAVIFAGVVYGFAIFVA